MPTYKKTEIAKRAAELGFQRDVFEKVLRLNIILAFFQENELLHKHFALKGGTAINLAIFPLPRLSVDIDMDYIPNDSRKKMIQTRDFLTKIIKTYMENEGYQLSANSRFSHSLDAFYYLYQNAGGNRDNIKIELNYSLRSHVLPIVEKQAYTNFFLGHKLRILDPMEIFAAKLNALISRATARDLYDINNLVMNKQIISDIDQFRKMVVFYHTISAKNIDPSFSVSAIDGISFTKIRRDLFPVLSNKETNQFFDLEDYKNRTKSFINDLMILSQKEKEYIDCFIQGEYRPDLLFDDQIIISMVKEHPMAIWKCINNRMTL